MSQRYSLDYYKREKAKFNDENKKAKRDMMLNLGTVDQYDQRGKVQQKKIKVLKSKIQILEKSLSQIVEDFEKEKELVRFQHEQIIREQKEEVLSKTISIIVYRFKRDNEKQKYHTQESQGTVLGYT